MVAQYSGHQGKSGEARVCQAVKEHEKKELQL